MAHLVFHRVGDCFDRRITIFERLGSRAIVVEGVGVAAIGGDADSAESGGNRPTRHCRLLDAAHADLELGYF